MTKPLPQTVLLSARFDTPLGAMVAIADDAALHLLEFADRPELDWEKTRLCERLDASVTSGHNAIIQSIEREFAAYFAGVCLTFKTPVALGGTPFQRSVWRQLLTLPPGKTSTYSDLASAIGKPKAVRAVGHANGANPLAIIVPCHRVIRSSGDLAGYGGGIPRKKWLIEHEAQQESGARAGSF